MRKLLVATLAGCFLAGAENKTLAEPQIGSLPASQKADEMSRRYYVADALVCQLWEKMGKNKYVIDSVADALEKMGAEAGNALAKAVREGFVVASNPSSEQEQKKALHVAKRAAMILGELGHELDQNLFVITQLTCAAQNCAHVCGVSDENKEALREAREAAIEALGEIFKNTRRSQARADAAEAADRANEAADAATEAAKWEGNKRTDRAVQKADAARKAAAKAVHTARAWTESETPGTVGYEEAYSLKQATVSLQTTAIKFHKNTIDFLERRPPNAANAINKAVNELKEKARQLQDTKAAVTLRQIAIDSLACLLTDCDFAIKILSAEALARIYGKPEK